MTSSTTTVTAATTPTIRTAARRSLFWILAAAFLLVIALVTMIVRATSGEPGDPLSPTNAAPAGSMAVAAVLGQHGVQVASTTTYAKTRSALTSRQSTLLIYDPENYLSAERLTALTAESNHVVIVTPTFSQLRTLAPTVAQAGAAKKGTLTAGCALPAAVKSGTISGGGNGYRVTGDGAAATACFATGKSIRSLVQVQNNGATVTVLGADQVLANETVSLNGNAALALNLLGSEPALVWYLPSAEDAAAGSLPTIAELTPPWVSSLALLLIITAIVAAFWRGRRLGPLVVENLPVTVRASETMEGRARLYQKSSARRHALDALRIGSIERLARLCGLPSAASTAEVITAVAGVTGRNMAQVATVLLEAAPETDRDLIRLSDELVELEAAVTRAVLM